MFFRYNRKTDIIYFQLADSDIIESQEIASGVIYDFDENHEVVGVEILNFQARNREELKKIDLPFSPDQLDCL